jgi:TRAP transporter TAXI family solute receptor
MISRWKHSTLHIAVFIFYLGIWSVPVLANNSSLTYDGGPVGGTFNQFAKAMADFINRTYPDIEISFETSGGSTANLKRLNNGDIDFGIVYSGDAYLGRNGRLAGDDTKYENVRALGFLYGVPVHLVTRAKDRYKSTTDLAGKRVAVGNAGSSALTAAERFFKHLGLWDKIEKKFLGYSVAAAALIEGKLDAFWVFVGYPNTSVIEAASHEAIHLIDVGIDAEKSGFYEIYPFYQPMKIPAGTYSKQDKSVKSFQDAAYWCTNTNVSDELVYRSLKAIYSPDGLKHMVTANKTAKSMSLTDGIKGVSIPLHSGAEKFWNEKGLTVPDLK